MGSSSKRISPFDDNLGIFANEVLLGEDEEGAGGGPRQAGQTDVVAPPVDVPQGGVPPERAPAAVAAAVGASPAHHQVPAAAAAAASAAASHREASHPAARRGC